MRPSPFVLSFFGSLGLLILTACRSVPVQPDGERQLTPLQMENIEDEGPALALAWYGVALHREVLGDEQGALVAYQAAIEADPDNDALYLSSTRKLIEAGRRADAFRMLDRLLEHTPDNLQALRWKARLLMQDDQPEKALAVYETALDLQPEEETFYLEALQAAVQAGNTDLALTVARAGNRTATDARRITEIYLRLLDAASENAEDLAGMADLQDELRGALDAALDRYAEEASLWYLNAEKAFKAEEPESAFRSYQQVDRLAEDQDETRARILVHAIQQLGGGRAGTRDMRALLEARTKDALAQYLRGLLWELQGSNDRAVRAYSRAVDLSPEDSPSLRKLAVLFYQQGKAEQSLALLEDVLELDPDNPEMTLLAGRIALASGQYAKAAAFFGNRIDQRRQGIELADAPSIHTLYAIALWESGSSRDEMEELLEVAAAEPGNLETVWRQRYQTILQREEEDEAEAERLEEELLILFQDLCDRLQAHPEPALLTASTHSIRKEFSLALEFLEEVRFRAEQSGSEEIWLTQEYWFDVAAASERTGNHARAEEIFLRIIDEHPDHHSSLNYIAYMWAEKGEHLDRAYEFVQRALREDPENASYIDTLGWIYFQQGEFEKAYRELVRASELMPEEPVIAEHLGDVLMKLGRPVEARGYYRITLALDPGERLPIVQEALQAAEQAVSAFLENVAHSVPE
jgi:tetratricopeptide (TPR) repeat protein